MCRQDRCETSVSDRHRRAHRHTNTQGAYTRRHGSMQRQTQTDTSTHRRIHTVVCASRCCYPSSLPLDPTISHGWTGHGFLSGLDALCCYTVAGEGWKGEGFSFGSYLNCFSDCGLITGIRRWLQRWPFSSPTSKLSSLKNPRF